MRARTQSSVASMVAGCWCRHVSGVSTTAHTAAPSTVVPSLDTSDMSSPRKDNNTSVDACTSDAVPGAYSKPLQPATVWGLTNPAAEVVLLGPPTYTTVQPPPAVFWSHHTRCGDALATAPSG